MKTHLQRSAARFAPLRNRRHFQLATLQTPWVCERRGLKSGEPLDEMKLLAHAGKISGGADARVQIARNIWWAWPLFALAQIPGAKILLRAGYHWVARCRSCLDGKYRATKHRHHGVTTFFEMP